MKKLMSLMMLVCACLLSQPMQAQKKEVTPDDAGYIVKVGDFCAVPGCGSGKWHPLGSCISCKWHEWDECAVQPYGIGITYAFGH